MPESPGPALPWGTKSVTTVTDTALSTDLDSVSLNLEELSLKIGDRIEVRSARGIAREAHVRQGTAVVSCSLEACI